MSKIHVVVEKKEGRHFPRGVCGKEIVAVMSPELVNQIVALSIIQEDGVKMYDLSHPWNRDLACRFILRDEPSGLEILRHDAAHVMAQAVQELFPGTQVTIGPAIQDGFYYDFSPREPFSTDDLERIEERMRLIVDRDDIITRHVWTREQAISFFQQKGELFKVELIESIPPAEVITVYQQGDFFDLCRGPHLPSTGYLGKAFKLLKLAGAYWRGDSKNPMLQRIYGTAWASPGELKAHLLRLEEAQKRDHRKLGREMGLFHFQEEAPGNVFWHPDGWTIYLILKEYIRGQMQKAGYLEVNTPQLVHRKLWESSGHWDKFHDSMITFDMDNQPFAFKPMNCPCHVQIFRQGIKSYRDLPLRLAEFGSCVRYEPSGSLMGLMRMQAFVQDDAHIFCTPDQTIEETKRFCKLLSHIYERLGFADFDVYFSDRPKVRAGTDLVWDQAEAALRAGAEAANLEYKVQPGEGAFYGPKLEFSLKDALGRRWQCGTLQLDFILPERLGAQYITPQGTKARPVMLHRAILGSIERFIGVLIEHYAGKLPLWLAPVQGVVATVTDAAAPYAGEVFEMLKRVGLRVQLDSRNEKIPYKVRELSLKKIPYILVVGEKEAQSRTVSLRRLDGKAQEVVPLDMLSCRFKEEATLD